MKRALVLSLAVVLGLGFASFAQTLSGEWTLDVSVTTNNPALSFADALDFSSSLTVNYEVGGWLFTSYTEFDDAGWADQTFAAGGSLGAWTFDSLVDFAPTGAFEELDISTSIALGGMTFGFDFVSTPGEVTLDLIGAGSTSLVDVEITVSFGNPDVAGCDLDWTGVAVEVGFPFCCADITATIAFDCLGFDEACFAVDGISVGNIPWLTLGAEVCFQTESKTLTLTPSFDFGADVCFDVYFDVATTGGAGPATVLNIGDITIDGIGLECEIGGIAFTAISYWGVPRFWNGAADDYPGLLMYHGQQYWEAYQIATTDDACCGPFGFDIAVFFDANSTSLFDIALFEASMTLQVATQFEFAMGLEYDVVAGAQLWTLGFVVTW